MPKMMTEMIKEQTCRQTGLELSGIAGHIGYESKVRDAKGKMKKGVAYLAVVKCGEMMGWGVDRSPRDPQPPSRRECQIWVTNRLPVDDEVQPDAILESPWMWIKKEHIESTVSNEGMKQVLRDDAFDCVNKSQGEE